MSVSDTVLVVGKTDANGRFRISSVPPGNFQIRVSAPGYASTTRRLETWLNSANTSVIRLSRVFGSAPPPSRVPPPPIVVGPPGGTADGGSQPASFPVELTWNAWVEDNVGSPGFIPVQRLGPEQQYSIVLDLAAFGYGKEEGVFSRKAGDKLKEYLDNNPNRDTTVQALMLADSTFFEPPGESERVKDIRIDLTRMREVLKAPIRLTTSPLEVLRQNPESSFSFGRVGFRVKTGSREGLAFVAFSFWVRGIQPVDEFQVPLCIASTDAALDKCRRDAARIIKSSPGMDSVFVSAQMQGAATVPKAAVAFVELGPTTIGVFRVNGWKSGEYLTWSLDRSAAEVADYLRLTILPAFQTSQSPAALLQTGTALYRFLFPKPKAASARAALEKLLKDQRQSRDAGVPPAVFVRLLPNTQTPLFLVPLGLMAVDIDGQTDFLGFSLRVQTPLQVQNYQSTEDCVAKWVMLVPPKEGPGIPPELLSARSRFGWFDGWTEDDQLQKFQDMAKFAAWAGSDTVESKSTAVLVLSHHDNNLIFFGDQPRVASSIIQRSFASPSLAIIDACGAAGPGAADFVRRLNEHGIVSVIAASSLVDPVMAGDFFDVLAKVLQQHRGDKSFTISEATFLALQDLRHLKPPVIAAQEYGAKVLTYSVLGNGSLRVCLPPNRSIP